MFYFLSFFPLKKYVFYNLLYSAARDAFFSNTYSYLSEFRYTIVGEYSSVKFSYKHEVLVSLGYLKLQSIYIISFMVLLMDAHSD